MIALTVSAPNATATPLSDSAASSAHNGFLPSFEQMLGSELAAAPAIAIANTPAVSSVAKPASMRMPTASDEQSAESANSARPDILSLLLSMAALPPPNAPLALAAAPTPTTAAATPTATPTAQPLQTATASATSIQTESPAKPAPQSLLTGATAVAHRLATSARETPSLPDAPIQPPPQPAPSAGRAAARVYQPQVRAADASESHDPASTSPTSAELTEMRTRHAAPAALSAIAMATTPITAAPVAAASLSQVNQLIAQPFAKAGWDEAISQRVLWMAQDKLQSASLTLNPPQLGPVQVTVQIENQQASVQFVAASVQVQQALQDALPVLRDMFGQAGLSLGQAHVSSQQQQRNPAAALANPFMTRADDATDPAQPSAKTGTRQTLPMRRGLINLYA